MNALEFVKGFFAKKGWSAIEHPELSVVSAEHRGTHGVWECFARVRDNDQVIFYSIFPSRVPHHRRLDMAEFITRINYGLVVGNFELDMDEGELRYKTAVVSGGLHLRTKALDRIVALNLATFDTHFLAIAAVVDGAAPPAEIAARFEI